MTRPQSPAHNERGNIDAAIKRMPLLGENLEIIFVEGHSSDGTWEEIERVVAAYPHLRIKALHQPGKGKADAVFAGFDVARGDILIILDSNLTVPPERLPKFWQVIRSGKGEFVNGSRLIYPLEDEAMPFLNLIANRIFSLQFTWLLSQRSTDTLCGSANRIISGPGQDAVISEILIHSETSISSSVHRNSD
jgi:glycosyltransferase involved in cell wall biosynthesis